MGSPQRAHTSVGRPLAVVVAVHRLNVTMRRALVNASFHVCLGTCTIGYARGGMARAIRLAASRRCSIEPYEQQRAQPDEDTGLTHVHVA